jgi:hypothetical protein
MFGVSRLALFNANPVAGGGVSGGISYFFGGLAGSASTTVRKYNLVSGASTAGTALPSAFFVGAAFGNGVEGWQVGGFNGGVLTNVRYNTFSSDTWTTLTALSAGQRNQSCASSSTKGYSWAGFRDPSSNLTVNNQWTYATDAFSAGSALPFTAPTSYCQTHNNSTIALWIGSGADAGGGTPTKQYMIYTFSSDTTTYSANGASYNNILAGMTGPQDHGVIISGLRAASGAASDPAITGITKYNLSDGSLRSDSESVGTAYSHGDGAGSDEQGIYAGRTSGTRSATESAYTYATNTRNLLSAYLSNNQVFTADTQSPCACHNAQIS